MSQDFLREYVLFPVVSPQIVRTQTEPPLDAPFNSPRCAKLTFSPCRPPRHPQNWPTGDEVLEEWTKKVAEEHKSHW